MSGGPIQARNGLCRLPAFRPVALKVLKLLTSDDAEVHGIANLLKADPALSAQILAAANSVYYGNAQHVDSLPRAILVVGFQRTKSLTVTVALRSFAASLSATVPMENWWRHSLAAALLAEEVAPYFGAPPEQAYTAALMHDIGRLGLLMAYEDKYAPLLGCSYLHPADCMECERDLFEIDHCQAGLWLTERWGFPPEYSRVAGCHHVALAGSQGDLASLTRMVCRLGGAMGFPAVTYEDRPTVAEIMQQLPQNRWNPYQLDEDSVRTRIQKHVTALGVS